MTAQEKRDKLRGRIDFKFKSISKFSRLAGIDRYEIQKFFARKEVDEVFMATLNDAVGKVKLKFEDGEITDRKIKALKTAVKKFGGVAEFVRQNPEFAVKSIYQIMQGRRSRMTEQVQKLFERLDLVK
jgi:hypothetical protein